MHEQAQPVQAGMMQPHNMSVRQRRLALARLLKINDKLAAYVDRSKTNRVKRYWEIFDLMGAGKIDFDPEYMQSIADACEWERKWRIN